ncbi:MAG: carboxypeptidase regulatory-like domain-containing protein [Bryobacteraceae bacterium]
MINSLRTAVGIGVLGLASTCWAQPSATILGKVKDASDAVVEGAQVSATNTAIGLTRNTVTTNTGDFELPALPITGAYKLTVTKQGFQTQEFSGIVLQVDQQARYDVTMKVGSVSEKVEVTTEAPIINTEIGSIGQVIPNRTIVDLPLNGRNFVQLAQLLPNVVRGPSGQQTGATTIAVSGGRYGKTEFLLDGIEDSDQLYDGVMLTPSVDAIQEFKVQANSFSAEYGRGDAVVNATIKAGTNQYHGVLYEFLRNNDLDARNFFATGNFPYRQNQFGGSLGGPILHDKTFFFVNYEGTRIRQGQTFNDLVPTAAQRNGDFSGLSTAIKDPLTGAPFPGNVIPANRVDPSTAYFLQFIPVPNSGPNNFIYSAPFQSDSDQGNLRIDQRLGANDTLFGRYSIDNLNAFNPGSFPDQGAYTQGLRTQNAVISETHLFSPTVLNELRLGYARLKNSNLPIGLGTNYTEKAGINGFEQTSLTFPGFPQLSITGLTGINGQTYKPIINPTNTYEIVDSVSITRGAHNIKIGTDLRKYDLSSTNSANSRGNFSFSGKYSGYGFADFLSGYPSSGARSFPRNFFGEYETRYHFFAQDDWKVSSKLTLNLGLRYELNLQPTSKLGQSADFDFVNDDWIASTYKGNINLTTQQVAQFAYPVYQNMIKTAAQAGLPNKLLYNDYKNFAPRLGFAWRPFSDNRTVVRGGYGIFYLLTSGNNTVSAPIINVPFILDESKSQPTVNGFPTLAVENYFPPFSTHASFNTPLTFGFNPHEKTPYMNEWNVAIQRELVPDLSLEAAYVANKGTHLENAFAENIAAPGPGNYQSRVPFPLLGTGQYYDNSGNSIYNALEVKLEKRFSKGVSFLVGYQWGKSIDYGTNDQSPANPDNPFNYRTMRGPSDLDVGQRLVANFVAELPYGRGRAFGSGMNRAEDAIVGGWEVAGIATFQGGQPFTPGISGDPANVGFNYARRPDVVGDPSGKGCPNQCFNPAAFAVPAAYTIGDAGRNIIFGPGLANWDFSFMKNFHFTESCYLQLRSEFFNTFNHTQFLNPGGAGLLIDNANAGKTFSARDPRIIQFALKLYF